ERKAGEPRRFRDVARGPPGDATRLASRQSGSNASSANRTRCKDDTPCIAARRRIATHSNCGRNKLTFTSRIEPRSNERVILNERDGSLSTLPVYQNVASGPLKNGEHEVSRHTPRARAWAGAPPRVVVGVVRSSVWRGRGVRPDGRRTLGPAGRTG